MRRKVLVTDDDPLMQTLLKRALSEHDFEVICANHGLEALQIVERDTPDIILMDQDMPGLKGGDVLQELRSKFKTRMIPVIFLTGMDTKSDVIKGLEQGADDYLTKPVDVDELVARIDASLRLRTVNLDANPLTRLPGNHSITKEIQRRLDQKTRFSVLHVDLGKFKNYNDLYGFHRGDVVILETARILEKMAGADSTLIGHVGGDDFIVVTETPGVRVLCENILRTFDERREIFYLAGEMKKNGTPITLGIAVVNVPSPTDWTVNSISAEAARIKMDVKKTGRSGYGINEVDEG